jgi:hypothetical protein
MVFVDFPRRGVTMPHPTGSEHTYTYEVTQMSADPHHNEYLAAVAGLHEQTPSPARNHYAVGDFVSGETNDIRWKGRIQWFDEDRPTPHVVVKDEGSLETYPVADITH